MANLLDKNMKYRKSQVTIFIIIGLIIVTAIALVFVLITKPGQNIKPIENPQAFIKKCIDDKIIVLEKILLDGNGYLNISSNYILFSLNKPLEKVPYYCKSSQFYTPCVNQEPMLLEFVRREIENKTYDYANQCFLSLKDSIEREGYSFKSENLDLKIILGDKSIIADINNKITIANEEESKTFQKFRAEIQSPIYKILDTSRQIVNYESELCEFNEIAWMMNFRDIGIRKFMTSDSSKIYTLTDRYTGKKLSFAVRTCVLPAGI